MSKEMISKAMNTLTHGVYVLGVHTPEKDNLMTAAWLCQVSSSPAMLVVAVSSGHLTADLIRQSGSFTVSVLEKGQKEVALACGRISGRKTDKMLLAATECSLGGHPVIKGAAAQMECKVVDIHDKTNHTLFIAEVVDALQTSEDVLLYHKKDFF